MARGFYSGGFKGETAHPRFLRTMGMMAVLLSVVCVGLGIANTVSNVGKSSSSWPTGVGVGIWAPIPAFITGVIAIYVTSVPMSSKRYLGKVAFFSAHMSLPALIAITSIEIIGNATYPDRNSLPIAILAIGSILCVVVFFIEVVICFCTYAEEEGPLIKDKAPTPGYQQPAFVHPPGTAVLNFAPSNMAYFPASHAHGSNLPTAYYNMANRMPTMVQIRQ